MADRSLGYLLSFRSPVGIFTGLGVAGLVDRYVVRGGAGLPCIPGSSVKGRLRFFAERLLQAGARCGGCRLHAAERPFCKQSERACTVCRLFGNSSLPALLRVGQATLEAHWAAVLGDLLEADRNPVLHPDIEVRPAIAVSRQRRTALGDHLFFDEVVPATVRFEGTLRLAAGVTAEEERFLVAVGAAVDAMGARKAAGRGLLEGGVCIGERR